MRPSRVLALGPVPDARPGEVEQARLGGELPLVLGRQPRADARPRTRAPRRGRGRSRSPRARDREPPARRRALDLDEVVQPRRQRLPLLDVRRLAVGAGLAPAEDGGQRPRLDRRRSRPGTASTRTTGAGDAHRLPRREASRRRRRRPSPAPSRRTAAIPCAGSSTSQLADRARVRPSPRLASAHSVVSPSRPARADDCGRPGSRRRAASTRRSRAARRGAAGRRASPAAAPCRARSSRPRRRRRSPRRACRRRSASALCSSSTWSRFQRRVWWSMCRCSNQRARSTPGHRAVGEPLRPREVVVADARERQRRLALERDARADASTRAEAGARLLHRVEEDAVDAELAHELARSRPSSSTASRRVPTSHGL